MMATKSERAHKQTVRWLRYNGHGLAPLDPHAWELLARRLVARRRALRAFLAGALVAILALVGLFYESLVVGALRDDGSTSWSAAAGWLAVLAVCAMVAGSLGASVMETRADRAIAASLPRRVTRSSPVRLVELAGRRVLVVTGSAAAVVVLLAATAWVAAPGWPAVSATVAAGVAAVGCGSGIERALRRPVVADDGVTLALDERLRRTGVLLGAQQLVVAVLFVGGLRPFVIAHGSPLAVALVWITLQPLVSVLQIALILPQRWAGAPYGHGWHGRPPAASPSGGTW